MNYQEEINTAKNIFITKIFEPEENSLEFELVIGKVTEKGVFGKNNGSEHRQIYFDETCIRYKVYFETYISYAVLNESFEKLDGIFTGDKIRIYSESNFLNYLKADTFASSEYPGEFNHYAFISLNHIINIAAEEKPTIERK